MTLVSRGDAYELRVLDVSGRPVRLIRWEGRDRTVTDADIARARQDDVSDADTDEKRQRSLDFFDATPSVGRSGGSGSLRASVFFAWARTA